MLCVEFQPKTIARVRLWAERNYHLFYKRMYTDREHRTDKVFIGKLGEEAVGAFLGVNPSYDKYVDEGFDLQFQSKKVSVKTKRVHGLPVSFKDWYIHIPCDQYPKIKANADSLFGCLIDPPKAWIVGWLPMDEVDRLKVLHKTGQQIGLLFKLPPPDSYGILISYFMPPSSFLLR